ncbi:MAG: hypothetical protein FIA93_11075 [Deltaproteobacteria bacterium]|nr:hypothetical protein [Deltaproteobacteria bacterium]PWB65539.1 MAG: hypothetical protein C3F14_05355 [Deltaproteobacteria bacterium]
MGKTLLFIGWIVLVAAVPAAADDTANAGLAQALQAAAKWMPDAKLETISTPLADATGKSRVWQYSFHSPKAGKCVRIQIIKGMPLNLIDLGSCIPNKPISTKFVDSPIAMQQAMKAGFQPDKDDNSMMLSRSKDRLAKDKECWNVSSAKDFDPAKSVMRGWCVDAKSGTFLMRLSGEL